VKGLPASLVLLVAAFSSGCTTPDPGVGVSGAPRNAEVQVVEVHESRYRGVDGDPLETACRDWRLSEDQVAEFFRLSQRYEQSPYAGFYQLPCSISGRLRSEGVAWDFTIGGGATATWSHDGQTRYFGCSADACGPLVLLPADDMDPE